MGTPTHEELCRVAYRRWEERGCPEGSPEIDWERAEQECARLGASDRAMTSGGSPQRAEQVEPEGDASVDRRLAAGTAP